MTGTDDSTSSWIATRPIDEIDAEAVVDRWWGRQGGEVEVLPSERDRNMLIRTAGGGEAVVLKVSNLAEDHGFLDCQTLTVDRLAAAGLPVARSIPTIDGRRIVDLGEPGPPYARLLPWLPGRPLVTTGSPTDGLLADLGGLMGRVTVALSAFEHPAAHRSFQWDVAQAVDVIAADLDDVVDAERRHLLARVLRDLQARLVPALPGLRTSLIHNDANDHNVLVDDAGAHVVGLLDFGDMLHSVTAHEVAVAIAYAMLLRTEPVSVVAPIIGPFDDTFPLTGAELDAIPDLIIARLAASVAIAAHQGRLDPDPYLRISETPAWAVLERLGELGHAGLRAAVHEAVGR